MKDSRSLLMQKYAFLFVVLICCTSALLNTGCSESTSQEWFENGYALMNTGKVDEAIIAFTKTIEKDPKYVAAYYNRAVMYLAMNDYRASLNDFQKVMELDPSLASPYAGKGYVYEKMGRMRDAVENYKIAARMGDKDVQTYLKQKDIPWQ